jgi:hypothetical protein
MRNSKETPMATQRATTTPRSALARCLILAGVMLGMYAFGPPSAAHAGTYNVLECHSQQSGAVDAQPFANGSAYPTANACGGSGNGLAAGGVYTGSHASGENAGWELRAPAGTLIRGMSLKYQAQSQSACADYTYIQARGDNGGVQVNAPGSVNNDSSCMLTNACGGIPCFLANGPQMAARDIIMVIYCDHIGSSNQCVATSGSFVFMRDLDLEMEDLQRPAPASLGGSVVAGGPRRGTESLVANASDQGSGVAAIDVYVNGGKVNHQDVGCDVLANGTARQFTPCPTNTSTTFSAPTDQGPWHEGANALRVCSTDFGGLETCADTSVNVDNSCDDSAGTTVGSNLDAGLARGNEQPKVNTVVSSNEGVQIKGSVRASSGAPVAGANVCVYEQVDGVGEDRALADIVHTKSNGTFTSRLDPGPNRNVYVDYRHSNLVLEKQLNLGSVALPTLKIRKRHIHNGHNMRFKGTIPGPYNAGRGVTIQARVGKTWRTFEQVTTNTVGEFKGRYKFKHSTLARARYTFRAVVKQQNGYPFRAGNSNKANVIVKG